MCDHCIAAESDEATGDPLLDSVFDPADEGLCFTELFNYLADMNAGLARIIPCDEDERPIGGIFALRGEAADVQALREAAETVARTRATHIEPGEGDCPWGVAIGVAKRTGFEFVVTPFEHPNETRVAVVTVGAELTTAVADAIEAVEARWEEEDR